MLRVQLQFSDAQMRMLRETARAEERSVAAVVRDAVDAWLAARERDTRTDRAPAAIGGFHSGLSDLAENHDVYLVAGDLVSISEIAARAGRSINTIQSWRRRYRGFPKPMTQLAAAPIWDWDEVARWIAARAGGEVPRAAEGALAKTGADIPGFELIVQGMADLKAGRETVEGLLLRSATERLASVGIEVPGGPLPDAPTRMYRRLVETMGEGQAHSRFNALRRRLVAYLNAARMFGAQTA